MSLIEQALSLYEKIDDKYSIARCKYILAIVCGQNGDGERAVQLLQEARELWAQINFEQGVAAVAAILSQLQDNAEDPADE